MHGYRFADRTEQQTVTDFVYTHVFADCMAMTRATPSSTGKQLSGTSLVFLKRRTRLMSHRSSARHSH